MQSALREFVRRVFVLRRGGNDHRHIEMFQKFQKRSGASFTTNALDLTLLRVKSLPGLYKQVSLCADPKTFVQVFDPVGSLATETAKIDFRIE